MSLSVKSKNRHRSQKWSEQKSVILKTLISLGSVVEKKPKIVFWTVPHSSAALRRRLNLWLYYCEVYTEHVLNIQ